MEKSPLSVSRKAFVRFPARELQAVLFRFRQYRAELARALSEILRYAQDDTTGIMPVSPLFGPTRDERRLR